MIQQFQYTNHHRIAQYVYASRSPCHINKVPYRVSSILNIYTIITISTIEWNILRIVEGKKFNSKNYECQGFRYVKVRESQTSTFLKCALFRTHGCQSFCRIDKLTDLLKVTHLHNHSFDSHDKYRIILSNQIK